MGALKTMGGVIGKVVVGTALVAAGYFYGPNIEYMVRGVPAQAQMKIVYSGKGPTLETYIQQGKEKFTLDNFAINRVYSMHTQTQQLIATRIVNERFTSTEKLGLVENIETQLTEVDKYTHEKATAVRLVERITSEYVAPLNPFYRLQTPEKKTEPGQPAQPVPSPQPSQSPSQSPAPSASPTTVYTPTKTPSPSVSPSKTPAPTPTVIKESL